MTNTAQTHLAIDPVHGPIFDVDTSDPDLVTVTIAGHGRNVHSITAEIVDRRYWTDVDDQRGLCDRRLVEAIYRVTESAMFSSETGIDFFVQRADDYDDGLRLSSRVRALFESALESTLQCDVRMEGQGSR